MARNNRSRGGGAGNARGGNQNPPPQRRPQRPPPPVEAVVRVKIFGLPKAPSAYQAQQELIQKLKGELTEVFEETGHRPLSVFVNLAAGSADVAFRNKNERDQVVQLWNSSNFGKMSLLGRWHTVVLEPRDNLSILSRIGKATMALAAVAGINTAERAREIHEARESQGQSPTSTTDNAGGNVSEKKPADSGAHNDPREAKPQGAAGATGDAGNQPPKDKAGSNAQPNPEGAQQGGSSEEQPKRGRKSKAGPSDDPKPRPRRTPLQWALWFGKEAFKDLAEYELVDALFRIVQRVGQKYTDRAAQKAADATTENVGRTWRSIIGEDTNDEIAIVMANLFTDELVEWAEWLDGWFGRHQRKHIERTLVEIAFRGEDEIPRLGGERTRNLTSLEYAVWIVKLLLNIPNRDTRKKVAIMTFKLCLPREAQYKHEKVKSTWSKFIERLPAHLEQLKRWFGRTGHNAAAHARSAAEQGIHEGINALGHSLPHIERGTVAAQGWITRTPGRRFVADLFGDRYPGQSDNPIMARVKARASRAREWAENLRH